jgi:signal peptidase II
MTRPTGDMVWRVAPVLAVLGTIGCDRATKHLASTTLAGTPGRSYLADTVRLGYVENPGGFLSLGASLSPDVRVALFTVGTGILLLVMLAFAVRRRAEGWVSIGLALFVSGGVSNWFDRLERGSVVDFLNLGIGPLRTGIFNVADVAILLGALVFGIGELRSAPPESATDLPKTTADSLQVVDGDADRGES